VHVRGRRIQAYDRGRGMSASSSRKGDVLDRLSRRWTGPAVEVVVVGKDHAIRITCSRTSGS